VLYSSGQGGRRGGGGGVGHHDGDREQLPLSSWYFFRWRVL
jgi:hypothetical protein